VAILGVLSVGIRGSAKKLSSLHAPSPDLRGLSLRSCLSLGKRWHRWRFPRMKMGRETEGLGGRGGEIYIYKKQAAWKHVFTFLPSAKSLAEVSALLLITHLLYCQCYKNKTGA